MKRWPKRIVVTKWDRATDALGQYPMAVYVNPAEHGWDTRNGGAQRIYQLVTPRKRKPTRKK